MLNAAALAYTTLLALVPLMTVSIAVFAAFPVADRLLEQLQDFVFENFVPAAGAVVQSYLAEFSVKAAKLTGPSFLFLVVTSLLLMASIDRAFNDIWRVQRQRRPVTKFLIYWAVITVGPLLMGLSIALTSYLLSLPLLTDAAGTIGGTSRLLRLAPWLASTLAFTLLYMLVPLRRVRLRDALAGGVAAAVLFELAKRGFGTYLAYFPTYEAVYGALATIPIFLLWIFLSWLVTLFGAELTYCLGACSARAGRARPAAVHRLEDGFALVEHLWRAQQRGEGNTLEALAREARLPVDVTEELVSELMRKRWVAASDDGAWFLSRDAGILRLRDLYSVMALSLPRKEEIPALAGEISPALLGRLEAADQELEQAMDVPLTELFGKTPEAGRGV